VDSADIERPVDQAQELCTDFDYPQHVDLVTTKGKHFDVLTEGHSLDNRRGYETAIELLVAGIRGRQSGLRWQMNEGKSKPD
jgi:hypothetical protein